jgi:hypothetical protein
VRPYLWTICVDYLFPDLSGTMEMWHPYTPPACANLSWLRLFHSRFVGVRNGVTIGARVWRFDRRPQSFPRR